MPVPLVNVIEGRRCAAVVCQPRGRLYRWFDGRDWPTADELPREVLQTLPPTERARCERHAEVRR